MADSGLSVQLEPEEVEEGEDERKAHDSSHEVANNRKSDTASAGRNTRSTHTRRISLTAPLPRTKKVLVADSSLSVQFEQEEVEEDETETSHTSH